MKITLVILDGLGLNVNTRGNALAQAKRPTIDEFETYYLFFHFRLLVLPQVYHGMSRVIQKLVIL